MSSEIQNDCIILLSTYNGSAYIQEQLDSILKQSYQNFLLLIRDDASTDNTRDILQKYANEDKRIIIIIDTERKNLKPCNSFSVLLQKSKIYKPEYIFLCDQDDVWKRNKLELFIKHAKDFSSNNPLLLHSDLTVVDDQLNTINQSMWKSQKLYPENNRFENYFVQNNVTGCVAMLNSPLLNLVDDLPKEAIMHDWWLALLASCFGEVKYFDEKTILYRQHNNNDTGAKYFDYNYIMERLKVGNVLTKKYILQTQCFLKHYGKSIPTNKLKSLEAFVNLKKQNKFSRIATLIRYKIFKNHWVRTLALLLYI